MHYFRVLSLMLQVNLQLALTFVMLNVYMKQNYKVASQKQQSCGSPKLLKCMEIENLRKAGQGKEPLRLVQVIENVHMIDTELKKLNYFKRPYEMLAHKK